MKKIIVILLPLILLCGCQSKKKIEKELKLATNNYYDNYVKDRVEGLDNLEITLGELRDLENIQIDLSKVSKCDDDTKIIATIEDKQITNYKFELKC